jgi:hypothetical protein
MCDDWRKGLVNQRDECFKMDDRQIDRILYKPMSAKRGRLSVTKKVAQKDT